MEMSRHVARQCYRVNREDFYILGNILYGQLTINNSSILRVCVIACSC